MEQSALSSAAHSWLWTWKQLSEGDGVPAVILMWAESCYPSFFKALPATIWEDSNVHPQWLQRVAFTAQSRVLPGGMLAIPGHACWEDKRGIPKLSGVSWERQGAEKAGVPLTLAERQEVWGIVGGSHFLMTQEWPLKVNLEH